MSLNKERKIEMEWPELGVKVTATLADDKNPRLCDVLWNNLPIESIQGHSLVAGQHIMIPHNIVSFVKPEYEEDYTARKYWGNNTLRPGSIRINTFVSQQMSVQWGPERYEPGKVAPIAFVDEKHLDKLREVGKKTLAGMFYIPVKYYKVIIRREG